MPVLIGWEWQSSGPTTVITWSFGASDIPVLSSNRDYDQFDGYIPTTGAYRALIQKAFEAWETVANISFVQVSDGASVDIRLGDNLIDGADGTTVGRTQSWSINNIFQTSEVYFDVDAYASSFYAVAVHEIGHAIGLDHSPVFGAVMYPSLNGNRAGTLTSDDIQGVQEIYGARSLSVPDAVNNILRTAADPAASNIAAQAASGVITAMAAVDQIIHLAEATTSVATLTFQFFTGKIPTAAGVDYLISPSGGNANSINSAYYQSFNLENRYINFAVNMGVASSSHDAFQSAYGSLSLLDATRKAYTAIFGATPTDAKVHAVIDPTADYLAYYGGDGVQGLGTKAAMVGWLLAEAAKSDVGAYAHANDAFLIDLSDGAAFAVDLIGVYGKPEYAFAG